MKFNLSEIENTPFWQASSLIKAVCAPIFGQFLLNYFDYTDFTPDSTCISVSSNPEFIKFLLGHEGYKCAVGRVVEGKHLWESYFPFKFIENTREAFDYSYGITFVRQKLDFIESINFSAPSRHTQALSLYLNHPEIFEYFLIYFAERIEPFFQKNAQSRIILPVGFLGKIERYDNSTSILKFINDINIRNNLRKNTYLFEIGCNRITLSFREMVCLAYLNQGFSNKKIAKKMGISVRTINAFCEKLLAKAKVSNRLELVTGINFELENILKFLIK